MLLNQFVLALFYVLFGPFLIIFDSSIEAASRLATLDPTDDLVAVFSVLRHGDRAPTDFYPLDPFSNASFWAPNGIGELNQLGIERMREAGRLYRARYQAFLERTGGWPRYVRSSTRNRTIESARYFLEGFLQQQESPESVVKITLDQRMLTTSYPCNRSNAAWLEWFQSAQVTGYMASKREDISFLGGLTGEDYFGAAPFTLRQLEFLATTTTIERDEYSLDVPAWIRNQSNIELMDDFKRHAYLFDWRPPTVQRYRVGPLLGDIRDNAQALIEESGNSSQQTFFLYSTHDVNQVLLLQALGLYEQIGSWPTTYSSAIVFELYQSGKSTHLVRTLYRQVNTTSALFATFDLVDLPLNISACAQAAVQVQMILAGDGGEHQKSSSSVELLCPFEEFKALIKEKVPLNYEEECSRSSAAMLLKNALINSGGVVLALLLLLVSTVLL